MRLTFCIFASTLLAIAMGCQKQCYISEPELQNAHNLLSTHLEKDVALAQKIMIEPVGAPADVTDPNRTPMPLTLELAIAIALENGTPSTRGGPGQGIVDDTPITFSGTNLNLQSDALRVLTYRPALAAANLEESLSRFDAHYVTGINWSTTDALQQGLQSFQNGSRAQYQSSVVKAFADGGVANVSFTADYQYLQSPPTGNFSVFNPFYTTRLQFGYELPLWRDHGVQVNQLLNRIPGITGVTMPNSAAQGFNNKQAVLNQIPGSTGTPVEGILIARLRFDGERAEFERQIHGLVLNTMVAYWKLYQAYGNLYSFEEVMRLSQKAWMVSYAKFQAGAEGGPAEYYPVRAQFEEFRGERMRALGQVLEAERNLRGIMGLPVEDGHRLVPISEPALAPFRPDWCAAVQDALQLRPELVLARDNVRAAQLNLIAAQNFLKPDVRFTSTYSPVGFGTDITGNGTLVDGTNTPRNANALRSLGGMHFNDWSVGVIANVPIGFRLEHSAVRAAHLGVAQAHYLLKDQERRAERALTLQYQKLQEWYRLIEARNAERKAYTEAVNARIKQVIAGQITPGDIGLLDFQRRLASAQVKEYEAIAEYNNTIARLEWTKGTILQHTNVIIGEGPLPECAQVRAVEHERERSESIVLKQRPAPLTHPGRLAGNVPELTPNGSAPAETTMPPATNVAPKDEELGMPRKMPQGTPGTEKAPEQPSQDLERQLPPPRREAVIPRKTEIVPTAPKSTEAPPEFVPEQRTPVETQKAPMQPTQPAQPMPPAQPRPDETPFFNTPPTLPLDGLPLVPSIESVPAAPSRDRIPPAPTVDDLPPAPLPSDIPLTPLPEALPVGSATPAMQERAVSLPEPTTPSNPEGDSIPLPPTPPTP